MNIDIGLLIFRIFIIYLFILFGFLLKKRAASRKEFIQRQFTIILLYFVFPFLIITSLLNAQLSTDISVIVFILVFSFVIMFTGVVASTTYLRNKSGDSAQKATIILCTAFPNSIFLPFPIIVMIVGLEGLISATFFAIGYTLMYNTIGAWIAIKNSPMLTEQTKNPIFVAFEKLILFPPTLSVLIGLALKILFKPQDTITFLHWLPIEKELLSSFIDNLSYISLILALIVVGLTFETTLDSLKEMDLPINSLIRLVIAPSVGFLFIIGGLALKIPLTSTIIIPLIIQAISGPAVANIAFSEAFKLKTSIASAYITVITALSLIWLIPVLIVSLLVFPIT